MSLTYTTLLYNGVEMTLADWKAEIAPRTQENQGNDTLEFTINCPADSDLPFPFDANIILQRGRIADRTNPINPTLPASNTDGGGELSFTGGVQCFWGYCQEPARTGDGNEESLHYKAVGPYQRFFGENTFAQLMMCWNPTAKTMYADWRTDVVLGLSLTTLTGAGDTIAGTTATNLMSLGQQIKQICAFAQAASASEQAANGLGWPGTVQFNCDKLTTAVDGTNYDLLQTPSTNCLLTDYAIGPLSGKTSASTLPAGSYMLRAPLDAANNITCLEAMRRQLQWLGGIGSPVVWTDHSQTPPQLHIATRDQLTPVSLAYSGLTIKSKIRKCTELIPPAVHFKYKVNGTAYGQPFNYIIDDIAAYQNGALVEGIGSYGNLTTLNGVTAISSAQETSLRAAPLRSRAVVQTLDLQGNNVSAQQCKIATASISSALGSATDAAWLQLFPELRNVTNLAFFNGGNPGVTITSPDGLTTYYSGGEWQAVGGTTTDYVNWVTDGQVAPWMMAAGGTPANPTPGQTIKAKITVRFAYTQELQGPSGASTSNRTKDYHEKDVTVTLTTLSSGTYYSTPSINFGEPIPYGLAGYYLALESIPQYEGTIEINWDGVSDPVPLGSALNLTGGRTEWETMNAVVQSVSYDFDNKKIQITIGPAGHLGPKQFVARSRTNLGQRWYLLMNVTPVGLPSSDNSLGNNLPALAPVAGGENATFMQMLASTSGQITSPDSTHLPSGLHFDATGGWGGGTAPSISTGHPQIIAAAGGTANQYALLDGGRPRLLLNYSSTLGVQIDGQLAHVAASYAGYSALLSGGNDVGLTLTGYPSSSAVLTPGTLTLSGTGGGTINAASALVPSGQTMQPLQIIFCIGGSTYSAYFLMTPPVSVS